MVARVHCTHPWTPSCGFPSTRSSGGIEEMSLLRPQAEDAKEFKRIYRLMANPGDGEGRHPAAHSGLGAWVGARVASPRRPILRPGRLSVSQRASARQRLSPWPWPAAACRPSPVRASSAAQVAAATGGVPHRHRVGDHVARTERTEVPLPCFGSRGIEESAAARRRSSRPPRLFTEQAKT
jgi:hypothetical protein